MSSISIPKSLIQRLPIPARITLIYILIGGVWILLSDTLLSGLISDLRVYTHLQTYKGWFYVLTTAALLYLLIRRDLSALEGSREELKLSYEATLEGWVRALDLRDHETEGHTLRVTSLSQRLAKKMGLSEPELDHMNRGALLHDIGKIGVPDSILLKPGELDEDEWEMMRLHPVYAYQFLSPIAYLENALDIPYCHHEWWDGTGYPQGLKGEQIPIAARIFAVVDVWDALLSDRPYRRAWPRDKVLDYIRSLSGVQFDPVVVQAFMTEIAEK